MEIRETSEIAVIGAGTMGVGIAQVAASAGHRITVIDREQTALDRGALALRSTLDRLVKLGKLDGGQALSLIGAVNWSTDFQAAADSALVVEAVVESLDVKQALFAQLEDVVSSAAILATNTSSLSVERIAEGMRLPARFMGLHFFNPVPVMKLVEVVAASATDPEAIAAATALMQRWGKRPVEVADVPGFIVNRIARPYYAEAFCAWAEGIEPAVIDAALTRCGGFRMGPLTLADMIGHDINYAAATSVFEGMAGPTRFCPQPAQRQLVERGELGRKSGRGVYDYGKGQPAPAQCGSGGIEAHIRVSAAPAELAPVIEGKVFTIDQSLPAGVLAVNGWLAALGDGRTLEARSDIDILIDHALDFHTSELLLATVRDASAANGVAALAQALDKEWLLVGDRPGQVVLRTYAQIAAGALDALDAHVATADAIDEAMVFGANYPIGPFGWLERFGAARLRSVLSHIADETGNQMYRPGQDWSVA